MTISLQFTLGLMNKRRLRLPETFLEQLSMGVAVFDQDIILRDYNPTWSKFLCRYTAITSDRLRADINLFDFLPEVETLFKPLFQRALKGETVQAKSLRLETETAISYWDVVVAPDPDPNEAGLMLAMLDVTEQALAYRELTNQSKVYAHGLNTLLEISHQFVSLEQESLLYLILDRMRNIEDYTEAGITKFENDQVTVLAYRGFVPQEAWVGWSISVPDSPIYSQVIYQRRPVIIPDIWSDSLMAQTLQTVLSKKDLDDAYEALRSWMAVPLMVKEQVIGMLFLGHRQPDRFSRRRAEMVQALADHISVALEFDRLSRQALNMATLEERDWLARELHDNVAQALAYMNVRITAMDSLLAEGQVDEARTGMQELKQIISETYTDVREEIFNLRAAASMGLSFLETLRDYLDRYRTHHDMTVDLLIEADESLLGLPAEVGRQVIRIIQEALINVRKHAGVRQAVIRLKDVEGQICISVEDNGLGFDWAQVNEAENLGFGLQIMAERAEGCGGTLKVEAAPGQGVKVIIWLPMTAGK